MTHPIGTRRAVVIHVPHYHPNSRYVVSIREKTGPGWSAVMGSMIGKAPTRAAAEKIRDDWNRDNANP